MAELKPCECRNNPKIVSKYCESDVGYDVQCKCGKQTRFYFGKQQAIDAWKGFAVARKFAMPAMPAERRRVHSEKWFAAKRASLEAFQNYLAGVAK